MTVAGRPIFSLAASTAWRAWPRAMPGARLNESVTAGNGSWWVSESGVFRDVNVVIMLSGTWLPFAART